MTPDYCFDVVYLNSVFICVTGIIVAVVVAGAAVLVGLIRLIVYCCQKRKG